MCHSLLLCLLLVYLLSPETGRNWSGYFDIFNNQGHTADTFYYFVQPRLLLFLPALLVYFLLIANYEMN